MPDQEEKTTDRDRLLYRLEAKLDGVADSVKEIKESISLKADNREVREIKDSVSLKADNKDLDRLETCQKKQEEAIGDLKQKFGMISGGVTVINIAIAAIHALFSLMSKH